MLGAAWGSVTVSTVCRTVETVETVARFVQTQDTQLKQGVNEIERDPAKRPPFIQPSQLFRLSIAKAKLAKNLKAACAYGARLRAKA